MSWFWVVIEISATLFEAMILFSFLNSFFKQSIDRRWIYVALPLLHTIFVSLLNITPLSQMPTALITIVFSCMLVFVFYQGNLLLRIGLTIAFYAIWMASELGVLIILNAFIKDFILKLQQPSIERITAIVLSQLTIFIILRIVQQFSTIQNFKLPIKKSLPLYVLPFITIMIIVSMQLFWTDESSSIRFMLAGISLISLLFANFIVFDQYERFIQAAELQVQINQIKQNQATQIEKTEMMETQNMEVRKIAHDLKNSLLPSILYLQQGKQEQGLKNLEQLVETLDEMQKTPEITGHEMIDLILTFKISKAKESDITINVNSRLIDSISVPDSDICVIIGNAFDNAIEAVEKINDKQSRMIDVQLRSGRGIFSIKISNPVSQAIIIKNGRIKTSKSDSRNHGIGLNSIRELVNRNNGFLDLQSEDNTFSLSISFENIPLNA